MTGPRSVTVGRADAPRAALLFPGIASCIGGPEVLRGRALAQAWDARVTLVDVPGYGVDGARPTRDEARALLRGDFAPLARRMVTAALAAKPGLETRPVILAGYSLGCSLAACAAADSRLDAERLVLVEPAAIAPRNPLALGVAARLDDRGEPADPAPDGARRYRTDLAVLGVGVARGLLRDAVERVDRTVPVDLAYARSSRVVNARAVERTHRRLRAAGFAATVTVAEGRHGVWNDAGTRAALAREIRRGWAA